MRSPERRDLAGVYRRAYLDLYSNGTEEERDELKAFDSNDMNSRFSMGVMFGVVMSAAFMILFAALIGGLK